MERDQGHKVVEAIPLIEHIEDVFTMLKQYDDCEEDVYIFVH